MKCSRWFHGFFSGEVDFAHGLGTGWHSNRRSQVGKGGEDVEIKGRDDWNWGYLGSYVET